MNKAGTPVEPCVRQAFFCGNFTQEDPITRTWSSFSLRSRISY